MGIKDNRLICTKQFILLVALCMLLGIFVGRGWGIKHNFMAHPDEGVFYDSTQELMNGIIYGWDYDYEPVKPYPEGTYIFRLPFHLAAQYISLEESYVQNVCLFGRIASVFYYSIGAVLGLWLVIEALGGGRAGAVIYALTVVFSLFQIEISRYGTFDPISFFVLMLTIVLCCKYMRGSGVGYLMAACFTLGVAAAGKYPLAYFFLLPLLILMLEKKDRRERERETCARKKKICLLFGMLVLMLIGFLMFSPRTVRHPSFFLHTCMKETDGYMLGGNPEGFSTVPESMFSALVYQLFYSDLPLATVFAVVCAVFIGQGKEESVEKKFFSIILPVVLLGFLIYNCCLTTFFLRTLFPFYSICVVYAAAGLGRLCTKRGMRIAAVILCAFMCLRGAFFLHLLSDNKYGIERVAQLHSAVEGQKIDEVVWLGNFFNPCAEFREEFAGFDQKKVEMDTLLFEQFPQIEPGQLVVTEPLEHGWAKYCIFPPNKEVIKNITSQWETYKAENAQYYIGKFYPESYYYLFGWWVHGSTATTYEFPSCYVYYMPPA